MIEKDDRISGGRSGGRGGGDVGEDGGGEGEMSKYCPLSKWHIYDQGKPFSQLPYKCLAEKCAWWIDDIKIGCSIIHIAEEFVLRKIKND